MKLTKVHITNFQSIQDSNEFEIGDVTCLVGKNEAGKTALLKALYRLNPLLDKDGQFDPTDDYPRREVSDYEDDVEAGRRSPATVVRATYALEPDDIEAVQAVYGSECLQDAQPTVTLNKGYSNELHVTGLNIDEQAAISYLIDAADLPQQLDGQVRNLKSANDIRNALADAEQTAGVQNLTEILGSFSDRSLESHICSNVIRDRIPKFLYFDEYYQLTGQDNVEDFMQRVSQGVLNDSDHPLLGLIELARLKLDDLTNPQRTERLLAKLEAAANVLTDRALKHWSQNRHLRIKFDIRAAQPGDPPGMTSGTNVWGRVEDTKHMVSTALGTRSRGFIWFFSFLAWYSKIRRDGKNIVLLLDEPGLSLHGKAQGDLLRYFEMELKPHHQLIYSTHSVFMVDPRQFSRVRIVQDLSIERDLDELPEEQQGTKVITEVLDAAPDSLFPLQGALGHEIYQTLFIGPNSLVVEGVSDLVYIQVMSAILQERGGEGLSSDWTITPVGGADKVPTFVALIGAQTNLNVAVLVDYQKKDKQSIEDLYKRKLLKKQSVLTYADYVDATEADIEDMFTPDFYLKLVNGEYGSSIGVSDIQTKHSRILCRLERHIDAHPLPQGAKFNHYRPARYFSDNISSLGHEISDQELGRFERIFGALNKLL